MLLYILLVILRLKTVIVLQLCKMRYKIYEHRFSPALSAFVFSPNSLNNSFLIVHQFPWWWCSALSNEITSFCNVYLFYYQYVLKCKYHLCPWVMTSEFFRVCSKSSSSKFATSARGFRATRYWLPRHHYRIWLFWPEFHCFSGSLYICRIGIKISFS